MVQETALHALVCLLRAAEVDVCVLSEIDSLEASGQDLDIDTAGAGRAVVMEEGVVLLILRACAMFQYHDGVVKACCMLMRVGVMCSLGGGGSEVRMLTFMYAVLYSTVGDVSRCRLERIGSMGQGGNFEVSFGQRQRSPSTIVEPSKVVVAAHRTIHAPVADSSCLNNTNKHILFAHAISPSTYTPLSSD